MFKRESDIVRSSLWEGELDRTPSKGPTTEDTGITKIFYQCY